jgi:HD-like signal output (HDOD) protein
MLSSEVFFRNPTSLPTMPELALRLLRSMERDDLSLSEVANLISRDPSLAAKVLRLANSARFGTRQNVAGLREASMLLGLRNLRELALAACMSGLFPKHPRFDRARFWRHGVATAGHARTLAPACGLDPDVAYLAGLLLRTGRLLMLMEVPDLVVGSDALSVGPDTLIANERSLIGCAHPEVSAELARRWHFPDQLSAALAAAGDPLAAEPFSPLGAVLRLASTLSDAGERELPEPETLQQLHPALIERLGLDMAAVGPELLPFQALTIGVDQLLG